MFLFVVVVYCTLAWNSATLLGQYAARAEQTPHVERLQQVVRGGYWLTVAPIIFTVLVYCLLKRWSLSYDLLPAFDCLVLLSGVLAGAYSGLVRRRGPLRVHAVAVGLASPVLVYWLVWYQPDALYHRYPFTVKCVFHEYADARWTWDDEAMGYSATGLYRACWGFDYYEGDLNLAAHRPTAEEPPQTGTELEPRFWARVRTFSLSPAARHGQLGLVAQPFDDPYPRQEAVDPHAPLQALRFRIEQAPAHPVRPLVE